MIAFLVVPLLTIVSGWALGAPWRRWRRSDEKSIQAHRSTLDVIEHAAGGDDGPLSTAERAAAHVRLVGNAAEEEDTARSGQHPRSVRRS